MSVSFDVFVHAFLNKITCYDFVDMDEEDFATQVDQYLLAACAEFENVFRKRTGCSFADYDKDNRCFNWNFPSFDPGDQKEVYSDYIWGDEVVDIISDGMVCKWLKSFLYSGDNMDLGNFMSTKDFSPYSPSNFMNALHNLHDTTMSHYKDLIKDFSYNHGRLTDLHM